MTQRPQRPFVPHRTPKTAVPVITAPEFRLYKPFLPGAERGALEPMAFMDSGGAVESQSEISVPLRSIGDFLDTSPPASSAYAQTTSESFYEGELEEADELPPVEHFLDPLPAVDHFAPDVKGSLSDAWPAANADLATVGRADSPDSSESGWVETDWQHYDWRAAAALGESSVDEASTAWAATDWDGTANRAREPRESAAHAIATALDEIARRIREGDLVPSGPGPITDPATIAATLAALLGVRR
jgi:hypothetical protein